jgi:rRNA maturation endonuclease Nob1
MTANKDKRPKFEGTPVYRILIHPLTLGGFSVIIEAEDEKGGINGASFGADDLASALTKLRALIDPPKPDPFTQYIQRRWEEIAEQMSADAASQMPKMPADAASQMPKIKVEGELKDPTGGPAWLSRNELIAAGVLPGVDTPDPELVEAAEDAEIEKEMLRSLADQDLSLCRVDKSFVDEGVEVHAVTDDGRLERVNAERRKHGRPTLAELPKPAGCAWMLKYVKGSEAMAAHYAAECQLCGAEVVAAGHEMQA